MSEVLYENAYVESLNNEELTYVADENANNSKYRQEIEALRAQYEALLLMNLATEMEEFQQKEHDQAKEIDELQKLNKNLESENLDLTLRNESLLHSSEMDEKLKHKQDIIDELELKQKKHLQEINELNNELLLNEKYNQFINDHNELTAKYNKLEIKYIKQNSSSFGYMTWDSFSVIEWMISLNERKFNKYRDELTSNIINEDIDGSDLTYLQIADLRRIGIMDFQDQQFILDNIGGLVNGKKLQNAQLVHCSKLN